MKTPMDITIAIIIIILGILFLLERSGWIKQKIKDIKAKHEGHTKVDEDVSTEDDKKQGGRQKKTLYRAFFFTFPHILSPCLHNKKQYEGSQFNGVGSFLATHHLFPFLAAPHHTTEIPVPLNKNTTNNRLFLGLGVLFISLTPS